jgi:hypothetical protein
MRIGSFSTPLSENSSPWLPTGARTKYPPPAFFRIPWSGGGAGERIFGVGTDDRYTPRRNGEDIGEPVARPAAVASNRMAPGFYVRLYDDLAFAVEQAALPGAIGAFVGFMAARIAITHPDDLSLPEMENRIMLSASGTSRPSLSTTLMLMTAASFPSASMVVLYGVSTTSAGCPVVSTFSVSFFPFCRRRLRGSRVRS